MSRKVILVFLVIQFLSIQAIIGQSTDPDRAFGNRLTAKRLALVIGNSAYQNTAALLNPKNDAADMKAALESLGFEVIYGVDQNARQMKTLIRQFGDKLRETKAVGLFYYAGHGIASGGENYLVPIDADIPAEDEIEDATVSLSFLMNKMTLAKNDLNIVILDACRNNPFARKWSTVRDVSSEGGLAAIRQAPVGTLIAYATQPGNTASDGTLRNGLYTQELLQQMKRPNLTIEDVFKNVRSQVRQKSKNLQVPWESSSIEGDFYFASGGNKKPKPTPNQIETTIDEMNPVEVEREAWLEIQNSTNPQIFREFLKEYPNGLNTGKAKIRLEQLVWASVKDSRDKTRLQAYLSEFPNGANASRVRLRLTDINIPSTVLNNSTSTKETNGDEFTDSRGMKFVKIPGKTFYMGKYEVTQAEWKAVMGNNPSYFRNCPQCPVERVSWYDVKEFIRRLNLLEEQEVYRLPFQSEREYVMKSGAETAFFWGNSINQAADYAWYDSNANRMTHEVGLKKPNPYGLYDIAGNVWEWCEDGDDDSKNRVNRGGGWNYPSVGLNSSFRFNIDPNNRRSWIGFRLIRHK